MEKLLITLLGLQLLLSACAQQMKTTDAPQKKVSQTQTIVEDISQSKITDSHDSESDTAGLPRERFKHSVKQTVIVRQGGLQHCYQSMINSSSNQKRGEALVEFTITPQGDIKKISVIETDFKGADFIDCLEESIEDWKFDTIHPEGDELTVQFPFSFGN